MSYRMRRSRDPVSSKQVFFLDSGYPPSADSGMTSNETYHPTDFLIVHSRNPQLKILSHIFKTKKVYILARNLYF